MKETGKDTPKETKGTHDFSQPFDGFNPTPWKEPSNNGGLHNNKDPENDIHDNEDKPDNNGSGGSTNVTVDDVFNHDSNDGDYEASSNGTSTITTDTYGKQPEIEQDATSIQENKGQITTQDVFNIGGAESVKKDIETEEVLDASKKRTQAEQEDISQKKADEEMFHVGNQAGDPDLDLALKTVNQDLVKAEKNTQKSKDALNTATKQLEQKKQEKGNLDKKFNDLTNENVELNEKIEEITGKGLAFALNNKIYNPKELKTEKEKVTVNSGDNGKTTVYLTKYTYTGKDEQLINLTNQVNNNNQEIVSSLEKSNALFKEISQDEKNIKNLREEVSAYERTEATVRAARDKKQQEYNAQFTSTVQQSQVVTQPAPEEQKPQHSLNPDGTIVYTKDGNQQEIKAENLSKSESTKLANDMEENGANPKAVKSIRDLAEARENLAIASTNLDYNDPKTVKVFQEANEQYKNNLKQAIKNAGYVKATDFNKKYNAEIANSNNFSVEVTLPNGEKKSISYEEFMSEAVTHAPEIAAAMYSQKAEELRANGHPMMAKVADMQAHLVKNWFGSKFVGLDNKIRNVFNQIADLNMHATYNAYNNVLNHEDRYTPEQVAAAKGAIGQAKTLKQMSAALKASTGFFSGIGDSHADGIYGTTNATNLNGWQKLSTATKDTMTAILGLGVLPMANKAYQNMYYLNPNNKILGKDFDKDGFVWSQEYGENAAAHTILGLTELGAGVALCFNPTTMATGLQFIVNAIPDIYNAVYGTRNQSKKVIGLINEITDHVNEVKQLEGLPQEAQDQLDYVVEQIEDFKVKADQKDIDDWLEGAGSETNNMAKFNQKLSHDEWLALIRNDEVMKQLAKDKYAKKDNVD